MRIRIRVRTSPTDSYEWEHSGPRFRIGRNDDCQLVFQGDRIVSGSHAEIELSPAGAVLSDLRSANGTLLNGAPLAKSARLAVGDEVRLGQAGPRLEVLAIDLVSAPARNSRAPGAPPADARTSMAPAAAPPQPANAGSGTQMLLVEMRRQNQRSFALFGALGLVAIVALTGVVWKVVTTSAQPAPSTSPVEDTATAATAATGARAAPTEPNPTEPESAEPERTKTKPPAPPPPPPARPIEEVVKQYEAAVVWIGFEFNESHFVYYTGFAVANNVVVTTAEAVHYLKEMSGKLNPNGPVRFVAGDLRGTAVTIKYFQVHSSYQPPGTDPSAGIAHNVAVGLLDGKLPATIPLATDSELDEMNVKSPLLVLGFVNEGPPSEPFDKIKNQVWLGRNQAKVTSSEPVGAERPFSYRLDVADAPSLTGALENLAGAAVFNERGHVVGVLTAMGNSVGMVSVRNFRDLVRSAVP